jgi:hypothetical protein
MYTVNYNVKGLSAEQDQTTTEMIKHIYNYNRVLESCIDLRQSNSQEISQIIHSAK